MLTFLFLKRSYCYFFIYTKQIIRFCVGGLQVAIRIWQVGHKIQIKYQVCTEPKRCILLLTYSFLKAKSTIWRYFKKPRNFRKPLNALFAIYSATSFFYFQNFHPFFFSFLSKSITSISPWFISSSLLKSSYS